MKKTDINFKGKKALVVDDDQDFLEQTNLILSSLGFEVISADSQKKAEELIEHIQYDIAVFDLMLENHDSGFILSYKSKKKNPDVPVIMVTAVSSETGISFDSTSNEEKSWIKADVLLNKGIRPEQLEKEIRRLLK
ncbi:MAG TPA: response regulator [Victivallales bacterium]|nr:response regulator [Victivallales bacterium]HPO91502.1 response regulator [Victivallales bacterium]HRR06860.1 response regulator [Victivallales bacterium]HRR27814.1 response regulator [Victivallales bacterium]